MMNKKPLQSVMAALLGGCAVTAQAAMPAKALLQLSTGASDNFFIMGQGSPNESTVFFTPGTDGGISLLGPQPGHGTDGPAAVPPAPEPGQIDSGWSFFFNYGWLTTVGSAPTIVNDDGAGTVTLGMTGLTVHWNAGDIDMGADQATVTCAVDCSDGDTFTLTYSTIVPSGSFTGVSYDLNMVGTIVDQNQAPVATNSPLAAQTAPNASVLIDLAGNVTDPDGDGVDNTSFIITYTGSRSPAPTLSDDGSGMITYTDNAGTDTTTPDTFTYTVADSLGKVSASFTVEVSVITGNLPPIANSFTADTNQDAPVDIDVVANASDTDGNVDATTVAVSNVINGSVSTPDPVTGVVTFTPTAGFTGVASFDYTVQDDGGIGGVKTSSPGTVTITVNAPPVANDDAAAVSRNGSVTVDVLSNDTDSDGSIDTSSVAATQASHGTTTVNPDGTIDYVPANGYIGADSFTYTVNDDKGAGSNTATVDLTVSNNPPTAVDDSASIDTASATDVTIDVSSNDTDTDGTIDSLTTVVATAPVNGTATIDSQGRIIYTPDSGFVGSETFTYTIQDNDGGVSNEAAVIVAVSDSGAAVLPTDATLTIVPATITAESVNVTPADGEGSWFNMEVKPGVKTHVSISGFNQLALGTAQPGSEASPNIDSPWPFFGNQGVHQTTSPVVVLSDDGSGNVTLDFSGWDVSWNKIPSIPMNNRAHTPGFVDGVAIMTCAVDCSVGDTYKLEYSATVPDGDPSGFGNVKYFVHLEGVVSQDVPTYGGGNADAPADVDESKAVDVDGNVLPVVAGSTSSSVGKGPTGLTKEDIGLKDPKLNEKDGEQCIGGCVDFALNNVTTDFVDLVFKLNKTIPKGGIYRKLLNGVWRDFDESQGDLIGSGKSDAVTGKCQGPDGVFDIGLREGNDCLFMRLYDNGPNDADPAKGAIADPSGILLPGSSNTPPGSTSGCSISATPVDWRERADWLLVAAFIGLLALYRCGKRHV